MIPFNKPFTTGKEYQYIKEAVDKRRISGGGYFTDKCQEWLKQRIGCKKVLLTHSCTAALEMTAILADIQSGDEVIMPSFTFVSTANAFVLRGGVPIFVDVRPDTLNIDETKIEQAITSRTKAIVPVHYAGVGCEMDEIMRIADKYNLLVIEDAAHAILSEYMPKQKWFSDLTAKRERLKWKSHFHFKKLVPDLEQPQMIEGNVISENRSANSLPTYYKSKKLGSYGHMATFSFHETKNIISGEGGALLINDEKFIERAEFIWEKGTNRSKFFRGEVDKYTWVDIGSSYLPSDIIGAFLWAQLEEADNIQQQRFEIWKKYHKNLEELEIAKKLRRPIIPDNCSNNAHMYYILLENFEQRTNLIKYLKNNGINAVFHYIPLSSSPVGIKYSRCSDSLDVTENISNRILRLPFWIGLKDEDIDKITGEIASFLEKQV